MDKSDLIKRFTKTYLSIFENENTLIVPEESGYHAALAALITLYEIIKEEEKHEEG